MSTPDEKAQVTIPREYRGNMMILKFSYDFEVIVPMEVGAAILGMLSKAELFQDQYGKEKMIKPMDKNITVGLMSISEYEKLKLSFILNGGKDGAD